MFLQVLWLLQVISLPAGDDRLSQGHTITPLCLSSFLPHQFSLHVCTLAHSSDSSNYHYISFVFGFTVHFPGPMRYCCMLLCVWPCQPQPPSLSHVQVVSGKALSESYWHPKLKYLSSISCKYF